MPVADRDKFTEGTPLRYPIYDNRGVLVLQAGAVLNAHVVSLLARRGLRVKLNATLDVVAGGPPGTRIPVNRGPLRIGRHPNCRIRPASRSVSNYHCIIDRLPLSFWVKDLNSTNGTFVNGERVERPRELRDGDLIQFGDYAMRIEIYGALESDGDEARQVAQMILADVHNDALVPETGDTLVANEEMARELKEALRERGLA